MGDFPLYAVAFFFSFRMPQMFVFFNQPMCLFVYSFILFSGPFHSKKILLLEACFMVLVFGQKL